MRYRDCIFDLYGTLVDIHTEEDRQELWETLMGEYTFPGIFGDWEFLHSEYVRLVREAELKRKVEGEGSPEIDLEPIFIRLLGWEEESEVSGKIGAFAGRFRELSTKHIRLFDGAREMLMSLRENGQRVWLLSNAQRLFTRPELDMLGLAECFDGIYLSSDFGFKKPDPRFYRALLEGEKIDPASAIMVGNDGTCDIRGGIRVGLATLYIRSDQSPEEEFPEADYILGTPDMKQVECILSDSGTYRIF